MDNMKSVIFAKIRENLFYVVLALALALLIRSSVVQAYTIPSGSMRGTLEVGDQVLVNKFAFGLKLPFTNYTLMPVGRVHRGDVAVFDLAGEPTPLIKRVIGLPGDTIEVVGKKVYRNGRLLREPYARHADQVLIAGALSPRDFFGPVTVPPGKLFMMGDNRDFSNDSRFWGFADISKVAGKAMVIHFSLDSEHWRIRWERLGNLL